MKSSSKYKIERSIPLNKAFSGKSESEEDIIDWHEGNIPFSILDKVEAIKSEEENSETESDKKYIIDGRS